MQVWQFALIVGGVWAVFFSGLGHAFGRRTGYVAGRRNGMEARADRSETRSRVEAIDALRSVP